ncbi:MAG: DNA polymerase III subunit delta [Candidatus Gracilibacteria bacterium]
MPVFLFHGEDTHSHSEKLKFWQKEFEKKFGGNMNVSTFDGKDATANDIFQAASSMPFLAEKRFVMVKNFLSEGDDDQKHAMADLVETTPDFCILVFSELQDFDKRSSLWKKIQKIGKVTDFPKLMGSKLIGWIQKTIEQAGGQIEKDAIIHLSEVTSGDLCRLENEIAKLVGYAQDRPITKADIELLIDTSLAISIFKLTDSVGQRNVKSALHHLHHLIETGEELYGILHMIMRQFRIITSVKDLMDQNLSRDSITAKLKEHPFVVSNSMTQARNFSMDQLRKAYKLLLNLDTRLKSGGVRILVGDNREFVLALDMLVLDLCK